MTRTTSISGTDHRAGRSSSAARICADPTGETTDVTVADRLARRKRRKGTRRVDGACSSAAPARGDALMQGAIDARRPSSSRNTTSLSCTRCSPTRWRRSRRSIARLEAMTEEGCVMPEFRNLNLDEAAAQRDRVFHGANRDGMRKRLAPGPEQGIEGAGWPPPPSSVPASLTGTTCSSPEAARASVSAAPGSSACSARRSRSQRAGSRFSKKHAANWPDRASMPPSGSSTSVTTRPARRSSGPPSGSEACLTISSTTAGGQFSARAQDISANGFRAVMDLNVQGTWQMSSAFARAHRASGTPGPHRQHRLRPHGSLGTLRPRRGGPRRGRQPDAHPGAGMERSPDPRQRGGARRGHDGGHASVRRNPTAARRRARPSRCRVSAPPTTSPGWSPTSSRPPATGSPAASSPSTVAPVSGRRER